MIWLNNVRIESENGRTRVFVNDVELNLLTSISFNQEFDTVPEFAFETVGLPNIVAKDARVVCDFTPSTVREAVCVLENALKRDIDLYDAFRCSILSAIADAPDNCMTGELASRILDRIIGKG